MLRRMRHALHLRLHRTHQQAAMNNHHHASNGHERGRLLPRMVTLMETVLVDRVKEAWSTPRWVLPSVLLCWDAEA